MSWGVTFGSVEVRFQLLFFFGSIIDPLSPSPVPISFFFPSSDLICSSSLFLPPTPAVSSWEVNWEWPCLRSSFLLPPFPFVVAFLATPPTLPNSGGSMIGEKTGKQKDAGGGGGGGGGSIEEKSKASVWRRGEEEEKEKVWKPLVDFLQCRKHMLQQNKV